MTKIFYFNKLAELRRNPTLKNLMDLAKVDPSQASHEINDLAMQTGNTFSGRENVLWLTAYLMGMCSARTDGPRAFEEYEGRLKKFWKNGEVLFRSPYTPLSEMPKGPTDDGPKRA